MSVPGGHRAAGGPMGGPPSPVGWGPVASEQDTGPIPRVTGQALGPSGARGSKVDPAKVLGLTVAVLGALNFVWGFLPEVTAARSNESLSVFAVGPAYVPVLLLIAGLLALAAFLPGSERSRLAVAAVSVGAAAGAIVSLGTAGSVQLVTTTQVGKGMGAILLVVFGIVQAVVAVGAYVVGADFSQAGGARPAPGAPAPGASAAAPAWPGGPQSAGAPQGAPGSSWPADPAARPGWYGPSAGGYGAAADPSWAGGRIPDAGSPAADDSDTGPQTVVDAVTQRPEPSAPHPAADPPRPSGGEATGPNLDKS